jgi:hypothetical protein
MPVREAERRPDSDLAADAAPPQAEQPAQQFSQEGEVPAVAKDAAAPAATASEQAFDQKPAGPNLSYLDQGMHEVDDYRDACINAGQPEKWKEEYARGHTSAKQFSLGRHAMDWTLNHGQSASQAVKDFLAGPTIADYRAIAVARDIDELRDDLGDHTFDKLFGSQDGGVDAQIPSPQRLKINSAMYTTPYVEQMQQIADDYAAGPAPTEPEAQPVLAEAEEKPKQPAVAEEPVIVAEDLGKQPERELL